MGSDIKEGETDWCAGVEFVSPGKLGHRLANQNGAQEDHKGVERYQ